MASINYKKSGINYQQIDPIKKLAQNFAQQTAKNLKQNGGLELSASRGESAYVWRQGSKYFATVVEGLGTKNLVADEMYKLTGKSYYDVVGHDTVASIINDLVSVGASPLVVSAYWAVGKSDWLADTKRASDLVRGWKNACDLAGASWGGGETPALPGIINPETIDLGGSATGIIKNKRELLTDKNIRANDRIIFIKSNGINMNGLSLARAVATKLPHRYATKLTNQKTYGETLLTKSNIYARLIKNIFKAKINLHYASNITGHGLRKVMRGRPNFSYIIEKLFKPLEIFNFIQTQAKLSDYEMYQTFNMGQDYALFVSAQDVKKTLRVIAQSGFKGLDAGHVKHGERQVEIKPKKIIYKSESLDLR